MTRHLTIPITAAFLVCLMLSACGGATSTSGPSSQPDSDSQSTGPSQPDQAAGDQGEDMESPVSAPRAVLYEDDFSDPDSGWEHYREFDGVLDYENEGYRMYVNTTDNIFWVNLEDEYSDLVIEVEATKIGGPDENRYGVMCRYDTETYAAYYFLIGSDGMYGIGLYKDVQLELLGNGEMQYSEFIGVQNAINTIHAECIGDSLTLVVNGETLLTIQDDTLQSGAIGLLAGTYDHPGTDFLFDNLQVFEP